MLSSHIPSTFVLLGLCTLPLFAQTVTPKTQAPAGVATAAIGAAKPAECATPAEAAVPETPPDQAALTAARKIEDPAQQIAALQDILAKHPKSKIEANIRLEIFRAVLKAHRSEKRLVMNTATALLKSTRKQYRRGTYNEIASALLSADIYLSESGKYAKKALVAYKQKEFYAERREHSAKANLKTPSNADLLLAYNQARASALQNLGRLAIKAGRIPEGRRVLTEVLSYQPMAAGAHLGLAELAEKEGDEAKALDHLLVAKLAGRIPDADLGNLKRLYMKKYGSLETLEATLDQIYNTRFPSPLHVSRYEGAPERSARVVLAEFFTGAGCPPCAAADLSFDAVLERYSRDEVVLVVYHQHIPRPDPMASPTTRKRFDFYKLQFAPTYVIDGDKYLDGDSREAAQNTFDEINPRLERRLNAPATAKITLQAIRNGDKVLVKAAVEPITGDERSLRLQVVLVEESLRYSGENGIRFHPMVVRGIAGPDNAEGFKLEVGKGYEGEQSFDIPAIVSSLRAHLDDYEVNGRQGRIKFSQKMHEIDMNRLAVVAFVQDACSKAVLQSKFTKVGAQSASTQ